MDKRHVIAMMDSGHSHLRFLSSVEAFQQPTLEIPSGRAGNAVSVRSDL